MPLSFSDRFRLLLQHLLPHHLLSRLMYHATRVRWPAFKNWQIRWVVRRYQVDMSLAQQPDITAYPHFNAFFTRAIKPEARPIAADPTAIACPVDGAVSQAGAITAGRLIQAKGHDYRLQTLVGGDPALAQLFEGGQFATLYLSPRDYHRIHMPLAGRLRQSVYVPGRLYSVDTATTAAVPDLFARNERLVTIFDTDAGSMAMILVGAVFVAGIETVWSGNYGERMHRSAERRDHTADNIVLEKGIEMGRFNMGSTVILLFGADRTAWADTLTAGVPVRMGEAIGRLLPR